MRSSATRAVIQFAEENIMVPHLRDRAAGALNRAAQLANSLWPLLRPQEIHRLLQTARRDPKIVNGIGVSRFYDSRTMSRQCVRALSRYIEDRFEFQSIGAVHRSVHSLPISFSMRGV